MKRRTWPFLLVGLIIVGAIAPAVVRPSAIFGVDRDALIYSFDADDCQPGSKIVEYRYPLAVDPWGCWKITPDHAAGLDWRPGAEKVPCRVAEPRLTAPVAAYAGTLPSPPRSACEARVTTSSKRARGGARSLLKVPIVRSSRHPLPVYIESGHVADPAVPARTRPADDGAENLPNATVGGSHLPGSQSGSRPPRGGGRVPAGS